MNKLCSPFIMIIIVLLLGWHFFGIAGVWKTATPGLVFLIATSVLIVDIFSIVWRRVVVRHIIRQPKSRMGAITESEILSFAKDVLVAEGYTNYKAEMTVAEPSICLKDKILLRKSLIGLYPWQAMEEVLHEIAHIDTKEKDTRHGKIFYKRYIELLSKYLVA